MWHRRGPPISICGRARNKVNVVPGDQAAGRDLAAAPGFLPVYHGMIGARFTGGAALSVPIHLLLAANDRLLPPGDNSCSTELPPHATWGLLPECGHAPQWDNPAALAAAILRTTAATG